MEFKFTKIEGDLILIPLPLIIPNKKLFEHIVHTIHEPNALCWPISP